MLCAVVCTEYHTLLSVVGPKLITISSTNIQLQLRAAMELFSYHMKARLLFRAYAGHLANLKLQTWRQLAACVTYNLPS